MLTVSKGPLSSAPPQPRHLKRRTRVGNGRSIKNVEHIFTGMIMAKKVCVFLVHIHASTSSTRAPFPSVFPDDQYVELTITHSPALHSLMSRAHEQIVLIDAKPSVRGFQTDPTGTVDYSRLQFVVHHFFLQRVHLGSQHLHLRGVYG